MFLTLKAPDFIEMAKEPGLMSLSSPVTKATGGITTWLTIYVFNSTISDAFSLTPQGLYAHLGLLLRPLIFLH
jgi:hypothetical protein